jgi:hypothetical protein
MALANRLACTVLASNCRTERSTYLIGDLFLLLAREVDEMVVLGADKERNGGLVEASPLPVPLLDGVQGAFPCQVEHEEYGDGIVAHEWQHVDELALTAKIPDREGDFCVPD